MGVGIYLVCSVSGVWCVTCRLAVRQLSVGVISHTRVYVEIAFVVLS